MLHVDDVSFSYAKRPILCNVSFSMRAGESVALIGASGSGKTTLFKLLTGMLHPLQGSIAIAGKSLPAGQGNAAYMMQEDLLLPWRTVLSNIMLTAELGRHPQLTLHLREEARLLLQEMEMPQCAEMFPEQLSGGMRQRVSLARALLQKRPLLLLDEPFGSLDVSLREQMYVLLREVQMRHGTTMLMVTHDFRDALFLSDRILLLAHGRLCREWSIPAALREDPRASYELLNEMRAAMIHL